MCTVHDTITTMYAIRGSCVRVPVCAPYIHCTYTHNVPYMNLTYIPYMYMYLTCTLHTYLTCTCTLHVHVLLTLL